jgi:DNA-directed RNA polymerase beta' subunit
MKHREGKKGPLDGSQVVHLRLASPADIRQWSQGGEVKTPELLDARSQRPKPGGLFCERIFGPERDWECPCGRLRGENHRGAICKHCRAQVRPRPSQARRRQLGHIELAAPVAHCWFFRPRPSPLAVLLGMRATDLEKIIYFQAYVVIDPGTAPLKARQLLSEKTYLQAHEKYGEDFQADTGAEAIKKLLERLNLVELSQELRDQLRSYDERQVAYRQRRDELVQEIATVEVGQTDAEVAQAKKRLLELLNAQSLETLLRGLQKELRALTSQEKQRRIDLNRHRLRLARKGARAKPLARLRKERKEWRLQAGTFLTRLRIEVDLKELVESSRSAWTKHQAKASPLKGRGEELAGQLRFLSLLHADPSSPGSQFRLQKALRTEVLDGVLSRFAPQELPKVNNDRDALGAAEDAWQERFAELLRDVRRTLRPAKLAGKIAADLQAWARRGNNVGAYDGLHKHQEDLLPGDAVESIDKRLLELSAQQRTLRKQQDEFLHQLRAQLAQAPVELQNELRGVHSELKAWRETQPQARARLQQQLRFAEALASRRQPAKAPALVTLLGQKSVGQLLAGQELSAARRKQLVEIQAAAESWQEKYRELLEKVKLDQHGQKLREEWNQLQVDHRQLKELIDGALALAGSDPSQWKGKPEFRALLERTPIALVRRLLAPRLWRQLKQLETEYHRHERIDRPSLQRLRLVEALKTSGERGEANKPEWMVLECLPVIPPDLRPYLLKVRHSSKPGPDGKRLSRRQREELVLGDLNLLYQHVLRRNERLKKLKEMKAPEAILRSEKRLLQQAVDALLDNSRARAPVLDRSGRLALKSLTDLVRSKQGVFRQHVLGKRVNFIGRSVIVPGPHLRLYQCGLPKKIAVELFQPLLIREAAREIAKATGLTLDLAIRVARLIVRDRDDRAEKVLRENLKNRETPRARARDLAAELYLGTVKESSWEGLHQACRELPGDEGTPLLPLVARQDARAVALALFQPLLIARLRDRLHQEQGLPEATAYRIARMTFQSKGARAQRVLREFLQEFRQAKDVVRQEPARTRAALKEQLQDRKGRLQEAGALLQQREQLIDELPARKWSDTASSRIPWPRPVACSWPRTTGFGTSWPRSCGPTRSCSIGGRPGIG